MTFRMVTTICFILGLSVTRVVYGEKCGGIRSYLLARFIVSREFLRNVTIFFRFFLWKYVQTGRKTNESDLSFNSIQHVWLHGMLLQVSWHIALYTNIRRAEIHHAGCFRLLKQNKVLIYHWNSVHSWRIDQTLDHVKLEHTLERN